MKKNERTSKMNNELNGTDAQQNHFSDVDSASDSEAEDEDFSNPTNHLWKKESTEIFDRLRVSTSFGLESRTSSLQSYDAGTDVDVAVVRDRKSVV